MKTRIISVFVISLLFMLFSSQSFAEYYVVSGVVPEYYEYEAPGYMVASFNSLRPSCEYPCGRRVVVAAPCGYVCAPRHHHMRHKPRYVTKYEVVRVYQPRRGCSYYGCDNRIYEGTGETRTYEWVSP